ncbi:unnamed protein product, partial [Pleuronectes platessa]
QRGLLQTQSHVAAERRQFHHLLLVYRLVWFAARCRSAVEDGQGEEVRQTSGQVSPPEILPVFSSAAVCSLHLVNRRSDAESTISSRVEVNIFLLQRLSESEISSSINLHPPPSGSHRAKEEEEEEEEALVCGSVGSDFIGFLSTVETHFNLGIEQKTLTLTSHFLPGPRSASSPSDLTAPIDEDSRLRLIAACQASLSALLPPVAAGGQRFLP